MVQGVCIAVVWQCGVGDLARCHTGHSQGHHPPHCSASQWRPEGWGGGGTGGHGGAWGGSAHWALTFTWVRLRLWAARASPLHTNTNQHHTQSHLCPKTSTPYLYCNIEGHLYDSRCRYKLYHFFDRCLVDTMHMLQYEIFKRGIPSHSC